MLRVLSALLADGGKELHGVGQGLLGVLWGDLEELAVVGAETEVERRPHPPAKVDREEPRLDEFAAEKGDHVGVLRGPHALPRQQGQDGVEHRVVGAVHRARQVTAVPERLGAADGAFGLLQAVLHKRLRLLVHTGSPSCRIV